MLVSSPKPTSQHLEWRPSYPSIFIPPFQGQLSTMSYLQVFALVSKILFVNAVCCVCAAKFHFQFCCVYPATSPQSVDKELAMTARAKVVESLESLTENVKLMAVNPEHLFIKGDRYKVWLSAIIGIKMSHLTYSTD